MNLFKLMWKAVGAKIQSIMKPQMTMQRRGTPMRKSRKRMKPTSSASQHKIRTNADKTAHAKRYPPAEFGHFGMMNEGHRQHWAKRGYTPLGTNSL